MIINMDLGKNSYDIVVERGCLKKAGDLLDLSRKVLIITDDGVPEEYSKCIAHQCKSPVIECVAQGEGSKSFKIYEHLCRKYNLNCSECIFVDDRYENVEGAQRSGIPALRFRDFEQAKIGLEEMIKY